MTRSATKAAGDGGGVRMKYTGRNVGAITVTVEESGRSYPAGNNPVDRYQIVHPDDVAFLAARGFVEAPDEAQPAATAPTGERLPVQPAAITAEKPATPATTGETAYWAEEMGLSDSLVQAFNDAGITTLLAAQELSDADLDAIPGVGPATIAKIREAK